MIEERLVFDNMVEEEFNKVTKVIARVTQIKQKMIKSFLLNWNHTIPTECNKRYRVVYGWMCERKLTYKQFACLIHNIKIIHVKDFLYRNKKIFNEVREDNV